MTTEQKPAETLFDLNGKKLPIAEYQAEFEKLAAAARNPPPEPAKAEPRKP